MFQKCRFLGGLMLLSAMALPASAAQTKGNKPEDKPAAEKSADLKTADDPYAVPEGTTRELRDFIQKMMRNMPENEELRKKCHAAMLKAADKMLAAEGNDDDLDFAANVKMRSLDKPEDIAAFSDALTKAGHEKQSRAVRSHLLQIYLRDAVLSGKPDLQRHQIAAVLLLFKEAPPQSSDISLAIMTGQIAELLGDNAYALNVYRDMSKAFSGSKELQLAEFGKRLEGVVRRLSLLGNKMQLEGELFSGKLFDFSIYEGKVVLVDFWATWRKPCLEELPKLKKIYDLYHDKGFDIIGVSCDYRREDVEKFAEEKKIPWAVVYGSRGPSPTVEYYGILTIPTMILIGKDGNVKQLNVSVDDLTKQLEKLLAPAEKKKDKEKAAKKT